jgi:hypothetical protein
MEVSCLFDCCVEGYIKTNILINIMDSFPEDFSRMLMAKLIILGDNSFACITRCFPGEFL